MTLDARVVRVVMIVVTLASFVPGDLSAQDSGCPPGFKAYGERFCVWGEPPDNLVCEVERDQAALASCTRAIQSGRFKEYDLAELHYRRGTLLSINRQFDEAIADYTTAIGLNKNGELNPHFSESVPFNARAEAYRQLGNADRAIADYTEALRILPIAFVYVNRAEAYVSKRDFKRAIADYTKAIALEPDTAWSAYLGRARAYRAIGDRTRAIEDYEELLSKEPIDSDREEAEKALRELGARP